jgi:hypothetical protein
MTNEEWDRKVEFLLNQQAKFDADMEKLKEAQAATGQKLDRATENIGHLASFIHEGFGLTLNLFKNTDAKIEALADSLRDLAALMDRHIREGHKGLESG